MGLMDAPIDAEGRWEGDSGGLRGSVLDGITGQVQPPTKRAPKIKVRGKGLPLLSFEDGEGAIVSVSVEVSREIAVMMDGEDWDVAATEYLMRRKKTALMASWVLDIEL